MRLDLLERVMQQKRAGRLTGREAMRMVEQWRPDALVLDIGMPHANGIEVAHWVRDSTITWSSRSARKMS